MKHTELPYTFRIAGNNWYIDSSSRQITSADGIDGEDIATGEFIAKACNNHYQLLEALEDLISVTKGVKGIAIVKENAEEAIKKAEQ